MMYGEELQKYRMQQSIRRWLRAIFFAVLLVSWVLVASGCATVPTYNGYNRAEIDKAEKFNKRMVWIGIAAVAILPYSVYGSGSDPHNCRPHEDCHHH